MKIYFNTKAFDLLPEKSKLDVTGNIHEAEMLVLGAKVEKYEELTTLKVMYRFGVGTENIPEALIKKGSPKVYFPSDSTIRVLYESTADFATYLIFHMYYSSAVGTVDPWDKYTRESISGKTLLVMGLGNIGRRVADKMTEYLKVTSYDIVNNKPQELETLIRAADIITLHMPSTEQTKSFINEEKLSWMKENVILVNTARGNLVNEGALYKRLTTSSMRAAFDVFWKEPYSGKLKELERDKFYMTPHTASQTIEYVKAGFNDICDILRNYGERP